MATRQVSSRNLVGLRSLSFIRPQLINFDVTNTKPNTRLYPFFDGVDVSSYITPTGGIKGGSLVTDSAGAISGIFEIPAMTFNTGERLLKLQDIPVFQSSKIAGSNSGSASAKFTAIGMEETYQTTITEITTAEDGLWAPVPQTGVRDPLAQSFFTYGVKGGCFITKIDIFFQSKDSSIPIILEIREMSNGYPTTTRVSKDSIVSLAPSSVNISENASLPTTFTFSRPIYLHENKDYCFVLQSNSDAYYVWSSKLGEKSIETGRTIFEQPFVGTLFKSENNITWSAENTEDIKFTMYRAEFSATSAEIVWKANSYDIAIFGANFVATNGSPVVTLHLPFEHSHQTGDKIYLIGNGSSYRGIPNASISNPLGLTVTVVDSFTLTFNAGANATSSGTLGAAGKLIDITIDSGGSGYVSPSISITGGGGTGAAATANIVGGKITSITITNAGSGYISTPSLSLTDSSGSGAVLVPIVDTIFRSNINRRFQEVRPNIVSGTPPQTEILNRVRASNENYVIGNYVNAPMNINTHLRSKLVAVTPSVESTAFGTSNSLEMTTTITSDNTNVSPMLDIGEGAYIRAYNYLTNNSSNATSETSPTAGTSQAKYISQPITLELLSKDIRVMVQAASVQSTSFDVFVRTSLTSSAAKHTDGNWVKLTCTTPTNLSNSINEFKDYEFRTSGFFDPFDVYDIKIVLSTEDKSWFPILDNYRVIVLST